MCEKNFSEERDSANELTDVICFIVCITVPIPISFLLTRFVVAGVFKIEGWERSLRFYFYCFFVISEILLGYFLEKYGVGKKISNFLVKYFYRWL